MLNYTKKVIKHFRNPKFAGMMKKPDAVGEAGDIICGDIMKIFLKVKNDTIKDIRFQTYGCVAAIACSDVLCTLAKGKKLDKALKITHKDIIKQLEGLPVIKYHCSVLGTKALQKAIENYRKCNKNKK